MAIERNTFKATEEGVFSANGRSLIELPKSGYINTIDCLFRFNIQSLVGTTRAKAEDAAAKIVKSMRIRAGGSQNYYDVTDGRHWLFRNIFNYRGQMGDGLPSEVGTGAVAAADYYYLLRIHWGYDFYNLYDNSGVLPAADLQDLYLEINWGAFTDMYPAAVAATDYNLAASGVSLTVYEHAFSGASRPADVWPGGIPRPRVQAQVETISAQFSNLGFEVDLPVGDTISQTIVLATDVTTDVRQDGIGTATQSGPTELGVKFPRERKTKWQMDWEQFKQMSKVQSDVAPFSHATATLGANLLVPYVGAGIIRWPDITGRSVGFDLTDAQQGDAKLGFTVAHDGANNFKLHLLHIMQGPGRAG
jgi:hypothetical protein